MGKNNQFRMEELRNTFKSMEFDNIKTVSITGNVIFDAPSTDIEELSNTVERKLKKAFKFDIPVSLRTISDLQKLADSEPFKGITVEENTRLYVSFLSGYIENKLKIPFKFP